MFKIIEIKRVSFVIPFQIDCSILEKLSLSRINLKPILNLFHYCWEMNIVGPETFETVICET